MTRVRLLGKELNVENFRQKVLLFSRPFSNYELQLNVSEEQTQGRCVGGPHGMAHTGVATR